MALIRMVGVAANSKENHNRFLQLIPDVDRKIERGIIAASLCALHPVNDASTVKMYLAVVSDRHARVGSYSLYHRAH
jgi:hypothetical protein